jgi:hypothetical protein
MPAAYRGECVKGEVRHLSAGLERSGNPTFVDDTEGFKKPLSFSSWHVGVNSQGLVHSGVERRGGSERSGDP